MRWGVCTHAQGTAGMMATIDMSALREGCWTGPSASCFYRCYLRVGKGGKSTGGSQLGQTSGKEGRLGRGPCFPFPHPSLALPSAPLHSQVHCPGPGLPISSLDLCFHWPHCPSPFSLQLLEHKPICPCLFPAHRSPTPPESQFKCDVPGQPSLLTRACFPHLLPCFQNPRVSAPEATLNCLLLPHVPCGLPSSPCPLLPPSRSLCPPEGGLPMLPSPRGSEESPRTPSSSAPARRPQGALCCLP